MLPEPASAKKALAPRKTVGPQQKPPAPAPKPEEKKEDAKKPETGVLHRTTPNRDHEYWVYVPENYDPNIAHALVIWLHPANAGKKKDIEDMIGFWSSDCKKSHIIMLAPKSENETGWVASESDIVLQLTRELMGQYTIDRQRIVAHGMAVGGQLAFYLGFSARDLIRGVATTGAILTNQPKDNVGTQRLAFFLAVGSKDPLLKGVTETRTKLVDRKFAVAYREIPNSGAEYLDADTHDDLIHWIDTLDRQ